MQPVYENGLPFSDSLKRLLDSLIERIRKNKASMLLFDGGVGEGKTTSMVHCADYINRSFGLPPISLEYKNHPQITMGGEEFLGGVVECFDNDLPAVIYDEAGDFSKRGAMSRFNQTMNRAFETHRRFKMVVLMGLPCFNSIDADMFFKKVPRALVHIIYRHDNYADFGLYDLERLFYLKHHMKNLKVPINAYNIVTPNSYGHIKDLEPSRGKLLDIISTRGKRKLMIKSQIKASGLMGYKEMADKLGRSIISVRTLCLKNKIKHTKVIQRAKYFDDAALNRLSELIEQ